MSWARAIEQELFGPQASAADRGLALLAATLGGIAAVLLSFGGGPALSLATVIVFVAAFDLFGGLWSNAQLHAWRGVRRSWFWKVRFTALHPHAFVLAWAIEDYRLTDAGLLWGAAILGTAAAAGLPAPYRHAAALFICAVFTGVLAAVNGSPLLVWLPAACLLKLVAAFAARPDGDA